MSFPIVNLDREPMHPAVTWARALRSDVEKDSGRYDYLRWSLVLSEIANARDLLDIGIGRGQFPDAAKNAGLVRVRGADRKRHSQLSINADWDYVEYDLTAEPPRDLKSDVVTCMECIEHIKDPGFAAAVENLKALALKRLIVTVP